MAKETLPLDINNTPELVRLAEEVRTGTARLLRRDHENLAVLSPIRASANARRGRVKTDADLAAFRAAAGAWNEPELDCRLAVKC
jgi:hypothetical protein